MPGIDLRLSKLILAPADPRLGLVSLSCFEMISVGRCTRLIKETWRKDDFI